MSLWLRRHWLFVAMVAAPTLGAIVYYGLIASDVYVSESRFLVRNTEHQSSSGLVSDLLQSTGLGGGHTENDAASVHDYIMSRDALKELDDKLDLRKSFSNPDIDLLDRFPIFPWSRSFEKFYLYYGKHVGVESDSASSISVLTVRAFTAEDAYKINHALLDISERLVNTLNDRSRRDLIDSRSNARGVFIFRFVPKAALAWPHEPVKTTPEGMVPVVFRIDLSDPASFFLIQNFPMENRDVLYVSNAPITELNKLLQVLLSVAYPAIAVEEIHP